MKKKLIIIIFLTSSLLVLSCTTVSTPQIVGNMNIVNNNIIVNLHIDNITELETLITSGIEKEIIFTVELLRVWNYWPDEFVVSKKISKVIKHDNLRDHYRASSYDGITRSKRYFKDYDSVKDWIYNVKDVNLANVKGLEPGSYYIRIVVESKSVEQLPLLGVLMHFIPEVEMSLAKESQPFAIGDKK